MKKQFFYLLTLLLLIVVGCQKELSFEMGNDPAEGSLQSDINGDCLPKTVNGTYAAGTPLIPTTNSISIQVNVTKTGAYVINTDTVNGYYFRAIGTFTSLGGTNVTLRGNGTPFASGINNFTVAFDSTYCDIQVTVAAPAAFTLNGSPTNCTGAVVNGGYATGIPLSSSNTVSLNVNVTAVGSYNISTTYQGMTFQKAGVFSITGPQIVVLDGTGTPTTAGANTVPVTAGSSTCSFVVNVGSPGAGTLGGAPGACTPANVYGVYMEGTLLNVTDSVQVQVNVTTAGVCSITTNTVDGFSFSFTGNLSAGTQTIALTGSGTPVTTGAQVFTVTFGTSTCTFTVTVVPMDYYPRTANSNWSYEIDDDPLDSLYRNVITPTHTANSNTYNIFLQDDGITPPPDSSGYFRKSAGDYFEWFNAGTFFVFDNPILWSEYIFLKDNAAAGTIWKSNAFRGTITVPPAPSQAVALRFSYKILQKDVPVSFTTSSGIMNFTNVIVVEEKYEIEVTPGVWQDLTTVNGYGKSYYARGVGLIKYESFGPTGTLDSQQELRRYRIF
jgi:hypothetical protein